MLDEDPPTSDLQAYTETIIAADPRMTTDRHWLTHSASHSSGDVSCFTEAQSQADRVSDLKVPHKYAAGDY